MRHALLAEALHQCLRHHDVAKPHDGREHLGEGAGVDDARPLIEAHQRRQRLADIAVLAVVVVLDHDGIRIRRPVEQFEAAGERHGHAGRVLPCRGHEGGARILRTFDAARHDEAFRINRHRSGRDAPQREDAPRRRVARFLEPDLVAWLQDRASDEIEGIEAARRHDHLLGRAVDAAPLIKVPRNRLAQREPAERIIVLQQRHRRIAPEAAEQPAPFVMREILPVDQAGPEGSRRFASGRAAGGFPRPLLGGRGEERLGQFSRHTRAGAGPGFEIALAQQLLIGLHHRGAGDVQLLRKCARRRQLGLRLQPPAQDQRAQLARDLRLNRLAVIAVDADLAGRGAEKWSTHLTRTWSFPADHIAGIEETQWSVCHECPQRTDPRQADEQTRQV